VLAKAVAESDKSGRLCGNVTSCLEKMAGPVMDLANQNLQNQTEEQRTNLDHQSETRKWSQTEDVTNTRNLKERTEIVTDIACRNFQHLEI
jgi:hypothetical protein